MSRVHLLALNQATTASLHQTRLRGLGLRRHRRRRLCQAVPLAKRRLEALLDNLVAHLVAAELLELLAQDAQVRRLGGVLRRRAVQMVRHAGGREQVAPHALPEAVHAAFFAREGFAGERCLGGAARRGPAKGPGCDFEAVGVGGIVVVAGGKVAGRGRAVGVDCFGRGGAEG